MKITGYSLCLWLICGVVMFTSCEDSTPVGSGLLGEGDLSLGFSDGAVLTAQTELSDPLIAYTRINFFNTSFMMGEMEDPVFGSSSSSLFFEFQPFVNNPPDFSRAKFDSLVLMLPYSQSGFYGDDLAKHDIEVFRVTERMDSPDTILSNRVFAFDSMPIGNKENYTNGRFDSVLVFDPNIDTTRIIPSVLRIRLDDDLGKEIMNSPDAHNSVEAFLSLVSGLHVKSKVEGSSILSFDLSNNNVDGNVQLYYTIGADTMRVYNYPLNINRSTRFSHFEHDISNTIVESELNTSSEGDGVLYMQGMGGVNCVMDISGIKDLGDVFINHAELEFYVAEELLGDTSIYSLPTRLGVMRKDNNGTLVAIYDLFNGIVNNGLDRFYGGALEKDENFGVYKYAMNITNHVKQVYKDQESPYIYITVFDKVQNPQRIIVYGPNHSAFPAKLRVTYTNP